MYNLTIVTPEKFVFEDQVISLIAPGSSGYLEILTNHAAIITSLKPGTLTVVDKNKVRINYAVSGGILEMSHNKATLLADSIEQANEIDLKRSEESYNRALKALESPESEVDLPRAKRALKRAENRLKVYREFNAPQK